MGVKGICRLVRGGFSAASSVTAGFSRPGILSCIFTFRSSWISLRKAANCQTACKPGSVRRPWFPMARDGHSSGTRLAARLARPTRAAERESLLRLPAAPAAPIRSCSRWGLPCRPRCRGRGALLPHRFTLARGCLAALARAVCFLWHFPWGRPRRPLAGTVFPWSPDFPLTASRDSGRPAVWQRERWLRSSFRVKAQAATERWFDRAPSAGSSGRR